MIQIPSRPNLKVDFGPIQNPTTKLYRINLFSIKIDLFLIKIDVKSIKRSKKSIKKFKSVMLGQMGEDIEGGSENFKNCVT